MSGHIKKRRCGSKARLKQLLAADLMRGMNVVASFGDTDPITCTLRLGTKHIQAVETAELIGFDPKVLKNFYKYLKGRFA